MRNFHTDSDGTFSALVAADVPDLSATYLKLVGTITNDNAVAGNIGEIIESDVALGSAASISSASVFNMTTISLTAGDWDVCGIIYFIPAVATTTQFVSSGLSATSVTFDVTNGRFSQTAYAAGTLVVNQMATPIIACRFSLSSTTTIFLVGDASFAVSTMTAYGHIRARRMR